MKPQERVKTHLIQSLVWLKEAQGFAELEPDSTIRAMHFQVINALTDSIELGVSLIEA